MKLFIAVILVLALIFSARAGSVAYTCLGATIAARRMVQIEDAEFATFERCQKDPCPTALKDADMVAEEARADFEAKAAQCVGENR